MKYRLKFFIITIMLTLTLVGYGKVEDDNSLYLTEDVGSYITVVLPAPSTGWTVTTSGLRIPFQEVIKRCQLANTYPGCILYIYDSSGNYGGEIDLYFLFPPSQYVTGYDGAGECSIRFQANNSFLITSYKK